MTRNQAEAEAEDQPRNYTELHGKDRSRRKNKQKNQPRNDTEKTRNQAEAEDQPRTNTEMTRNQAEAENLPRINSEKTEAEAEAEAEDQPRNFTESKYILICVGEWLQSPWTVFHGLLVFD